MKEHFAVKTILTPATNPEQYFACLTGWQSRCANALRSAVKEASSELVEGLKWGHAVYSLNGPVLLIRAEPARLLFGFWRGQRLRHIEPRLKPGGKYEMATLELKEDTTLLRDVVMDLATRATELNRSLGDPTA